jgi:hypothetical protein
MLALSFLALALAAAINKNELLKGQTLSATSSVQYTFTKTSETSINFYIFPCYGVMNWTACGAVPLTLNRNTAGTDDGIAATCSLAQSNSA